MRGQPSKGEKPQIYLDSAATTLQKPPSVSRGVAYAMSHAASVGRGGHQSAMVAAQTVFACREGLAELFHVPNPEQVIFTHNATHGLNLAIKTLVKEGDTVLISGYEHNAVTRPLHQLGAKVKVARSPLFRSDIMYEEMERLLTPEVSCVICTHISNVFGYILPIEDIAALCRRRGVPFIVDAAQSAGVREINFTDLNAEFIAMPGHKGLYGPQGTGVLLCQSPPKPLLEGGTGSDSLEQGMPTYLPDCCEVGTHNVCGIAGLLAGVNYIRSRGVPSIAHYEERLMSHLAGALSVMGYIWVFRDHTKINQSGVFSVVVKGMDCEDVGQWLGERGVAVRAGLHCAPLAHRTAGTLESGTVRLSLSAFNTMGEMDRVIRLIAKLPQG